jgi:phenylpyruvate tautomerase PptA (4-oxalocrotonate tautomerase family)
MPSVEIELVLAEGASLPADLARRLAEALASVLQRAPGQVWVRVRALPGVNYAENARVLADDDLPVFVQLLLAQPPEGGPRVAQAAAVCAAVAQVIGRTPDRVHLEYAPAGVGRVAFGGVLVQTTR